MTNTVTITRGKDGVAVLVFDTPGSPVNILSRELFGEFEAALESVESDPQVKACVLASGKSDSFIAGANIKQILQMKDAAEGEAFSRGGHLLLNRMDSSKKPFVAAIHGAALGGGLEVALACHYRLATDHPKTVLGFPEVMLGLLPGGSGCQRLPRLIGLPKALPMLLTGKRLRAKQAKRDGLVDALTSPGGLVDTASRAARELAAGTLVTVRGLAFGTRLLSLPPLRSMVFKRAAEETKRKTRGLYPAPPAILECVETGLREGHLAGEEKEAVLFGKLVASHESKCLIRLFDAMTEMKSSDGGEGPKTKPRRLAVLGAGLMGEGIASVSLSLCPVVVKDVTPAMLARAAKSLHGSLVKRRRSGSLSRVEKDRQWSAVSFTTRPEDLAGADLVIEAVFEDLLVKRKVLAETEKVIADGAVFASNTSALPIAEIASEARRPERVLGMHYFSPVPKMPLLEVVVAKKTAGWAVDVARSFGVAQGKTVIVVKDGPGFYTTRILAPYMNESIVLLDEGAEVKSLDDALKDFGFPVGPMALLDEVGIDVGAHVSKDLGEAFVKRGLSPSASLQRLSQAGYAGRKNGRGFYRYGGKRGSSKTVNDEVYPFFGGHVRKILPPRDVADRLALLMVNEAVYCLQEEIIASPRDGDVGAILGLGFPPFRGGPFRYVDSFGAWAVVARMKKLAEAHGPRFNPAPLLVDMAKAEKRFYPE